MKKTKLSKSEILHLEKLARLTLTEEEIEKYGEQLSETIDYVKNLDKLNTDDISPTNSVVDLKNVTFEDGAENETALTAKEALQNAKKTKDGAFVVDRVL